MTPRKGETIEQFRARDAAKKREKWQILRRTTNATGDLVSETTRPIPTLKPQRIPGPATIKFETSVYDREGNVDRQFVRTEPALVAREALWEAISTELRNTLPRVEPIPAPAPSDGASLLTTYPIGDHHLGMLAWPPETDEPWDIEIAENLLTRAMRNLVDRAPVSQYGLVAVLGDFFHYDSFQAVTPKNRNLLDSDTRFPKMIASGIDLVRNVIAFALEKHQTVRVIIETGNHDEATSVFLALSLAAIYENEPRVLVDISPKHFHYLQFGKVLIGTHHGHNVKLQDLPLLMAVDCPEAWGASVYRYWYTGHVHHYQAKSIQGCIVESFGVLGPKDAYSAQLGYRQTREMKAITYHKEYGKVSELIVNPQMLE